jgi:hypothetical protein
MCPVCLTNAILIAAGAVSGGGLSVAVISKFQKTKQTNRVRAEQNENGTNGIKDKEEKNETSADRIAGGVEDSAQEDAGKGESPHAGGRCLGRRTAANAVDGGGEEIRI